MPRLFQIVTLLVLTLGIRPASGFSLLGPLSSDPGGEAWQVRRLGYSDGEVLLNGAIGSPKNLTHEYRWNTPIITYGFDPTFINYFGTNGMAAVDAAMEIMNSLPDLSTLSQELTEYPLEGQFGATTTFRDSRRVNFTAQALNLIDMKSMTLGYLVEQLGLASPERWTWTLRGREVIGEPPVTNFSVIMRNFDPVTYTPSRYVNGNRYTYQIIEDEDDSAAFEIPADPESSLYGFSSVANIIAPEGLESLGFGVFYTYLTRDDIGGLRYIYDRDNLNWESFPVGTQIFASEPTSLTLVTNIDLAEFSSFTRTNPPAVVQAAFPNLVILSNSVSITSRVDVVGIVITNELPPWGDPFTTFFQMIPILQTNPVLVYDYAYANVITNYSSPTTIVRTVLTGFELEPWSTPDAPVFRTNIVDEVMNLPSGGIIIIPPNVGRYEFIPGQAFTNIIATTNSFFATNVVDNGVLRPLVATEITFFTNVIYGVFPFTLQDPPVSALRGGVGKITFQRLGEGAIFTGTNFLHTNTYTATFITNRFGVPTLVTNVFRRVGDQPDILFGAGDTGLGGVGGEDGVVPDAGERSIIFVSNATLNSSLDPAILGGPGIMHGPVTVTFNNVGPFLLNQFPGVTTEETALDSFGEGFVWGSFDGSTNPPVVFPKDITLEDVSLLINGGVAP